jgi:hypothetical protein
MVEMCKVICIYKMLYEDETVYPPYMLSYKLSNVLRTIEIMLYIFPVILLIIISSIYKVPYLNTRQHDFRGPVGVVKVVSLE